MRPPVGSCYNGGMVKYFERGVFVDQGPFVTIRLWKGGVMVRNFSLLKPKSVRRHDGSIEVQFPDHPSTAQEAADRWASSVDEIVVNP